MVVNSPFIRLYSLGGGGKIGNSFAPKYEGLSGWPLVVKIPAPFQVPKRKVIKQMCVCACVYIYIYVYVYMCV